MLQFTSVLKAHYQDSLEKLMFFNPGQHKALQSIIDSIEHFGSPYVEVENGNLRVKVDKLSDVQFIFALSGNNLVGVIIYVRTSQTYVDVLHIAVDEQYSAEGNQMGLMLVFRLLNVVRTNASRVKGVTTVRVLDNHQQVKGYPVLKS